MAVYVKYLTMMYEGQHVYRGDPCDKHVTMMNTSVLWKILPTGNSILKETTQKVSMLLKLHLEYPFSWNFFNKYIKDDS